MQSIKDDDYQIKTYNVTIHHKEFKQKTYTMSAGRLRKKVTGLEVLELEEKYPEFQLCDECGNKLEGHSALYFDRDGKIIETPQGQQQYTTKYFCHGTKCREKFKASHNMIPDYKSCMYSNKLDDHRKLNWFPKTGEVRMCKNEIDAIKKLTPVPQTSAERLHKAQQALSSAGSGSIRFKQGDRVVMKYLRLPQKEYSFWEGSVLDFDHSHGRYLVKPDKYLKTQNKYLKTKKQDKPDAWWVDADKPGHVMRAFQKGDRVTVHSLKASNYNGQAGSIVRFEPGTGRYILQLDSKHGNFSHLKPTNLRLMKSHQVCSARDESQQSQRFAGPPAGPPPQSNSEDRLPSLPASPAASAAAASDDSERLPESFDSGASEKLCGDVLDLEPADIGATEGDETRLFPTIAEDDLPADL